MLVVLSSPTAAIALRMPKSKAEAGALTTFWVHSSFAHSSSSHAAMLHRIDKLERCQSVR